MHNQPANAKQIVSGRKLIGAENGLKDTLTLVRRIAKSREPILICGETGTGKSHLARLVHEESPRKDLPFIEIPLASINENLIESELFGHVRGAFTGAHQANPGKIALAKGGTVFLDEIGELSLSAQTRLLQFLQEGCFYKVGGNHPERVDVRVISATNRNLPALVRLNRFREDLYFRLAVLRIDLPPLRKRGNDALSLAEALLDDFALQNQKQINLSEHARKQIKEYAWPGNVREVQNILKRTLICLDPDQDCIEELQFDRPEEGLLASHSPFDPVYLADSERIFADPQEYDAFKKALIRHDGCLTKTADALGMSRFALYRRLKKLGLNKNAAITWLLRESSK